MKTTNGIGLYIHIPFCQSKCPYCDFHSARGTEEEMNEYLTALTGEIAEKKRLKEFFNNNGIKESTDLPTVNTVYIGGGTPSYFGGERIAEVIKAVKNAFNVALNAEITVEANPQSAETVFFEKIIAQGANRISLGLQSAVDSERRALGRLSGKAKAARAVKDAREVGFKNISLDLMCAIPNQTVDSLKYSIDFCAQLEVEHISSYMLKIEKNTVFGKKINDLALPDEDTQCEMYFTMTDMLEKYGYRQYEISNFAKVGFESRHNINYWKCGEYLGIGPASHSFLYGKRFFYPSNTKAFISGYPPLFDCTGGTPEEFIMLALRLTEGLKYSEYENCFGEPFPEIIKETAEKYIPKKYINISRNGISLTKEGFLISNTVIGKLLDSFG